MKPIDRLTGGQHSENMMNHICNGCSRKVGILKDKLSIKEYFISGFCQNCQDEVFGKGK